MVVPIRTQAVCSLGCLCRAQQLRLLLVPHFHQQCLDGPAWIRTCEFRNVSIGRPFAACIVFRRLSHFVLCQPQQRSAFFVYDRPEESISRSWRFFPPALPFVFVFARELCCAGSHCLRTTAAAATACQLPVQPASGCLLLSLSSFTRMSASRLDPHSHDVG